MRQDALRPGGGTEHWGTVMARSDLLVSLVKAGSSGEATRARSVAEAILAEECAKRHNVLAERLMDAMGGSGASPITAKFVGHGQRHREFLLELTPRRRIEDLVLPALTRQACDELIEEQHRAAVLRAKPNTCHRCANAAANAASPATIRGDRHAAS